MADKADRTELRTPIDGTVNRVLVSTEGATIKPGDTVLEIVPADATIVVEASVCCSVPNYIFIRIQVIMSDSDAVFYT